MRLIRPFSRHEAVSSTGLIAFAARFFQELTPPPRFAAFSAMNVLLQTGSSGRVPVPPEKRFLINRGHRPLWEGKKFVGLEGGGVFYHHEDMNDAKSVLWA